MSSSSFDNSLISISGLCNVDKICLNSASYWTEITVPGIACIPNEKPNMELLNAVNGKIKIISKRLIDTPKSNGYNYEGKQVTGKKLVIEGLVCLTLSYTALEETQKVHSYHSTIPFSAFVVLNNPIICGVCEDKIAFNIIPCLEDLFIKNINKRQVCVTATLLIQVKPTEITDGCTSTCDCNDTKDISINNHCGCEKKEDHCDNKNPESSCCTLNNCCSTECLNNQIIVKGVCPKDKIEHFLNDNIKGKITCNDTWVELSIPEILEIPCKKPDAEEILSVASKVEIISQKIIETPAGTNKERFSITGKKLIVEGVLKQVIMYTAKNKEQSVHTSHFDIPFSAYIVLRNDIPFSTKYKVCACIEDIFICLLNEREFFKNVTLIIKATELYC